MSNQVPALESLVAEIEVVWGAHSVGAEPMPPVVIARAGSRWSAHVAPTLPKDTRLAVRAVTAGLSDDFAESFIDTLHPVLTPITGALRRETTLSYDCFRPASVIPPVGVRLITGADAYARRLRIAPDWGTQSDWEQILNSEFPWAAATDGNQVLSICETARWSAHGAEAGVWTLPGARGRGLAGSVVGAWSSQCAGRVPRLYYSTSVDNASSQRVAERLGLSRIGELWFVTPDYH